MRISFLSDKNKVDESLQCIVSVVLQTSASPIPSLSLVVRCGASELKKTVQDWTITTYFLTFLRDLNNNSKSHECKETCSVGLQYTLGAMKYEQNQEKLK